MLLFMEAATHVFGLRTAQACKFQGLCPTLLRGKTIEVTRAKEFGCTARTYKFCTLQRAQC